MELIAENVHYRYNEGTPIGTTALRGVNCRVKPGRILGILGGTGSGKTTLIRMFNGLLLPTAGRILIDGREIREPDAKLRRRIGLVFQRPERSLFERTVFDDISFVIRRLSTADDRTIRDRVKKACDTVRLSVEEVADRSPHRLSGVEQRKAALAGVLVNEPELLVLDEPAAGLDPPSTRDLVTILTDFVAGGERSAVVVSHDMEPFLGIVDELVVLDHGRVSAAGTAWDIIRAIDEQPELKEILPTMMTLAYELHGNGMLEWGTSLDETTVSRILAERITGQGAQS